MRSTWALVVVAGILAWPAHAEEPSPFDQKRDPYAPRYTTTRPEPLEPLREVPLGEFMFVLGESPAPGSVRIDETTSTFHLKTPPYDDSQLVTSMDSEESGKALMASGDDPVLYGTFREAALGAPYPILPGLEMFGQQSKLLNDGLYAAVELRLEAAAGDVWPGKQPFLVSLATALAASASGSEGEVREAYEDALVFVGVAFLLGGGATGDLPSPDLHPRMAEARDEFDASTERSKPIGFYTWSQELSRVFRRDRWLMSPFDTEASAELAAWVALADVLARHPELGAQLRWWIALQGGMTNPPHEHHALDLVDHGPGALLREHGSSDKLAREVDRLLDLVPREKLRLVPQAANREADLMESLSAASFEEGDAMRALIDAIRAGELSLEPSPGDGWYAHQQYALEVLLRIDDGPEGGKLVPNPGYTKRLETAFASMFAMNRETHVKVLRLPTIGAPRMLSIDVRPELDIEPIPSYYIRTARAYRFLRKQVLEGRFGAGWRELAPLAEGGADDPVALGVALGEMESWFYGLYLVASLDIGLIPEHLPEEIPEPLSTVVAARQRLAAMSDPADPTEELWTRDVRFMVPAGQTPAGDLVTWNVLGISQVELSVSYGEHPTVTVPPGDYEYRLEFEDQKYTLLVPVFAEVLLAPGAAPLTRDELRALCDRHQRRGAIEEALRASVAVAPLETEEPRAGCACTLEPRRSPGTAPWLVAILVAGAACRRREDE